MQNATQERIICLLQWLESKTDPSHGISSVEILERWEKLGLPTDRRSVYNDIQILRKLGYEIHKHRGSPNVYWMDSNRLDKKSYFTWSELAMLLDAVKTCRSISQDETEILTRKLLRLASPDDKKNLYRPIVTDSAFKENAADLQKNLTTIFHAMAERKKVLFHRQSYNFKKSTVKITSRKCIIFSPYYVFYDREHYFVTGWSEEYSDLHTYRIDHIARIQITDQRLRKRPPDLEPHPDVQLTLLCDHESLLEVADRFGASVPICYVGANKYEATINTTLSPQLSKWLAITNIQIVNIKQASE